MIAKNRVSRTKIRNSHLELNVLRSDAVTVSIKARQSNNLTEGLRVPSGNVKGPVRKENRFWSVQNRPSNLGADVHCSRFRTNCFKGI